MGIKQTYEAIDTKLLNVYRGYAQKWEERGHDEFGLPWVISSITNAQPSLFSFPDNYLNLMGSLLETEEPTQSYLEDLDLFVEKRVAGEITYLEYFEHSTSRGFVALSSPLRYFAKKYISPRMPRTKGSQKITWRDQSFFKMFWKINRASRLPFLVLGTGFLAKAGYDLADSFVNKTPLNTTQFEMDLSLGYEFLFTGSSAYWKDSQHPNVGKKQKTLKKYVQDTLEHLKEELTPQSLPSPAFATESIEDLV